MHRDRQYVKKYRFREHFVKGSTLLFYSFIHLTMLKISEYTENYRAISTQLAGKGVEGSRCGLT